MRVLTGYMPPTEGKAIVAGYDVFDQPIEAKRRTGYLPETPPLYPEMTVRDYLTFVARDQGRAADGSASRASTTVMRDAPGSPTWRIATAAKLSKGYRQRVGLAQALLHNPEVLILDEPTAGLDPKQIIETRQLIKELAGDHTIILSTHILPEVSQTCQRVVIINKGRGRRRRHAGQPHVAAARVGDDVSCRSTRRAPTSRAALAARARRDARVAVADTTRQLIGFEIDSENGPRRAARARGRRSSAADGDCSRCGRCA